MTQVYFDILGPFTWGVFFMAALGVMVLNAEERKGLIAAGFLILMLPVGFFLLPNIIYVMFVLFMVMGVSWLIYRTLGSKNRNF
jgi:hypothetical protein